MVALKSLIDLVLIMIGIALICSNWEPPIQKSLQAIIVLFIGCALGAVLGRGIAVGLLAGTVAYWRGELFVIAKDIKNQSIDLLTMDKSNEEGEE